MIARGDGRRPEILQPAGWPRPSGYANGVAASGRSVFVAGQIGSDPATGQVESDEMSAQVARALLNVIAVLREGKAEPADVVRMTWFITRKGEYLGNRKAIGTIYRELFGSHFPAMSVIVVTDLLEDGAKVEIEATAVVAE